MTTWSKAWPTEPGWSLSYGDACFAESALRRHAGQEHRPKYAKWCNRLADMLSEQCAEIVRVSEERRKAEGL